MALSWKQPGMPISVGLHASLALAGLLSFGQPQTFQDASESIPVDILSESQFSQMTRGEREAKEVAPDQPRRVDRVAQKIEDNPAGQAPRQVDAQPQRQEKQEETAPEEQPRRTSTVTPPPVAPTVPPPVVPPQRPPEPVRAVPPPKSAAAQAEEDEAAEEALRQRQVKPPPRPEPPKPDQAALARLVEQQKAEEQKKLEEQKRVAEQQRQAEIKRQEEAKKREEQLAELKAKADEKKKAEDEAKKAAERKKRQEEQKAAETQRRLMLESLRQKLVLNRDTPENSGNTGPSVVSPRPNTGSTDGKSRTMSLSDREAVLGMIGEQIRRCWAIPPVGRPKPLPWVRVTFNLDGSLASVPSLTNSSADPGFRPIAESGIRAIRQCAPFRIPARFQPMFEDWRSIVVQLNPDDT